MTTVVIVDDHAMFRAGVRAELGEAVTVRAEAEDVDSAVKAIGQTRPDVVLLDVRHAQEVVEDPVRGAVQIALRELGRRGAQR